MDAIHVSVDQSDLPDEQPTKQRRTRQPRATVDVKAWETSCQLVLLVVSAVIAWQLDKDYLVMTQDELQAICSPLGRIISRQKWAKAGSKYLVDTQDYMLLTFAGLQYLDRITTIQKAEKAHHASQNQYQQADQSHRESAKHEPVFANNQSADGTVVAGIKIIGA